MRSTRLARQTHRFSLWRSLIIALVLCLHGGLWMAVRWMAEPGALSTTGDSRRAELALSVRLLDAVKQRKLASSPSAPPRSVVDHSARARSRIHAPALAVAPTAGVDPSPPRPAPSPDLQPAPVLGASGVATPLGRFIPGGAGFQQQLRAAAESSHAGLPDNTLAHAPHFAMADSRAHGLAGLARALQNITGAVDKVCLDADVDSHMSDQELLEHQLSRADLRQKIIEHNCNVKGGLP